MTTTLLPSPGICETREKNSIALHLYANALEFLETLPPSVPSPVCTRPVHFAAPGKCDSGPVAETAQKYKEKVSSPFTIATVRHFEVVLRYVVESLFRILEV